MPEAYAASDLVVCRAGASTLAEHSTLGKAAILVPYPLAVKDHQTKNAEIFARADAAVLLKESELSGDLLARKIKDLVGDVQKIRRMSANCARLAPKDAAGQVAATMERYTHDDNRV